MICVRPAAHLIISHLYGLIVPKDLEVAQQNYQMTGLDSTAQSHCDSNPRFHHHRLLVEEEEDDLAYHLYYFHLEKRHQEEVGEGVC